jgi:hypothetical protein
VPGDTPSACGFRVSFKENLLFELFLCADVERDADHGPFVRVGPGTWALFRDLLRLACPWRWSVTLLKFLFWTRVIHDPKSAGSGECHQCSLGPPVQIVVLDNCT